MQLEAVLALIPGLDAVELTRWVEQRWVEPEPEDGGWAFREIDVARVRLIHELHRDLEIGEDALPVVLGLIDQVYELRCRLKLMAAAIDDQPAAVRQAILARIGAG